MADQTTTPLLTPKLLLGYALLWTVCWSWSTTAETVRPAGLSGRQVSTPDSDCRRSESACQNDTDCYHRLFYAQSTCVRSEPNGQICKSQCKSAILRLYETRLGRRLLHTDLHCVDAGVADSVRNCDLDPVRSTVHCALAKLSCELDDDCAQLFQQYETLCDTRLFAQQNYLDDRDCPSGCASALAAVFNQSLGARLANCTCWSEDVLCQRTKETVSDRCQNLAYELLRTSPLPATVRLVSTVGPALVTPNAVRFPENQEDDRLRRPFFNASLPVSPPPPPINNSNSIAGDAGLRVPFAKALNKIPKEFDMPVRNKPTNYGSRLTAQMLLCSLGLFVVKFFGFRHRFPVGELNQQEFRYSLCIWC